MIHTLLLCTTKEELWEWIVEKMYLCLTLVCVCVCSCAAAYVLLAEEEATTITEAERLFKKALTIGKNVLIHLNLRHCREKIAGQWVTTPTSNPACAAEWAGQLFRKHYCTTAHQMRCDSEKAGPHLFTVYVMWEVISRQLLLQCFLTAGGRIDVYSLMMCLAH